MLELVQLELDRHQGQSWILDGFPRTIEQGKMLSKLLEEQGRPLNLIVHLNVPDAVIMSRIIGEYPASISPQRDGSISPLGECTMTTLTRQRSRAWTM